MWTGTGGLLSRRDYAIVARQFIAWCPCKNGNRPVGHGMIGSDRRATIRKTNQPWVSIRPCPTGRTLVFRGYQALRTWLPSYNPFGTKTPTLVREFDVGLQMI